MDCDTKNGIEGYLDDGLRGLNRLADDRKGADATASCNLHSWMVLGRYVLDACGSFSVIIEGAPADVFRFMPNRAEHEHTWPRVIELDEASRRLSYFRSSLCVTIPRHDKVCTYCGRGWDIRDCHDSVQDNSEEVVDLTAYVDETASKMKALLPQTNTHVVLWRNEKGIRSDRWIDLSTDPRCPSILKNKRGWTKDRIPDDYLIQPGDQGLICKFGWMHKRCNELRKISDYTKRFRRLVVDAGYENFDLSILPNHYCGCDRCGPWFMISTTFGDVEIGWRKHVIHIDWSRVTIEVNPDFSGEAVTQDALSIHAGGYEKAEAYLRTLRLAAGGRASP